MTHTPGPWRYSEGKVLAGRGYVVADISHQADSTIPNARLMTAAPDMLEVLQEIESFLENQQDADDGTPNDAMRHLVYVRAAIAKATTNIKNEK